MWQHLIVFCIVAAAAVHVGARYLPPSWRRRAVYFLSWHGARKSKMATWLDTTSGCGDGCSSCNSCSNPAPVEEPSGRAIKLHVPPRP